MISLSLFFLASFQEPAPATTTHQEIVVDQTLAIINDQVLTISDIQREVDLLIQERGMDPSTLGPDSQRALSQMALQSHLLDMLFQEGFRLSGMDPAILEQGAKEEIRHRQLEAGSIAAYALELAARNTTIEKETRRIKQQLVAMLYKRSELGLSPELGKSSAKASTKVSPQDVLNYYQANQSSFAFPASVEAQILMVVDEGKSLAAPRIALLAKSIADDSLSFNDAAQQHSIYRPELAGKTGSIHPKTAPFQGVIKEFLLNGDVGETSNPLQLPTGQALVRILKKQFAGVATLKETEKEIRRHLKEQKQMHLLRETVQRLRKQCYLWLIPDAEMALDTAFATEEPEFSEEL